MEKVIIRRVFARGVHARRASRVAGVGLFCVSVIVTGAGCGRSPNPAESEKPAAQTPAAQTPAQPSPVTQASAPSGAVVRRQPACDLITRDEMADILGAPVGRPMPEDSNQTTGCVYPPGETGSYAQAEVAIDWQHRGGPTFEKQLADAFGGTAVGRQVARRVDLGDEAAYNMGGVLSVRLGTALITVTLPMRPKSEEQAIAIGQKIVERLGGTGDRPPEKSATTEPSPPEAGEPLNILGALVGLLTDDEKQEDGGKHNDKAETAARAPAAVPGPDGLSIDGECADLPSGAVAIKTSAASKIPLENGLTLSSTWIRQGDDFEHECLVQIAAVTASYIDITQTCSGGDDRPRPANRRRVCRADLRDGFFYLTKTSSALPAVIGGATMFSLSQRSLRELKTAGRTRHRFISVVDAWRTAGQPLQTDFDGNLSAGRFDREPYPVIVNDRMVELPTIVALGNSGTADQAIVRVLDDGEFPVVLDYHRPGWGFRIHYTKISFPTGGELEKHLATEKRVDVYGIYFDFASDRLRVESGPVLEEIAGILAKNAGWTLTINGHTDNVGGDAPNLDLSRRRSASVRRALSERYQIDPARLTTAGFGASQPKEDNSTIEGRAKNRRVELVRQ